MSVKNIAFSKTMSKFIYKKIARKWNAGQRRAALCFYLFLIISIGQLLTGCGNPYQLSPYHAALSCEQGVCHQQTGDKVPVAKCTGCHPAIAERVKKGQGLHGQPAVKAAKSCAEPGTACHFEHRDGLLLPPDFQAELRRPKLHAQASGFALEGVHKSVDCQRCHRAVASGRTSFVNARPECASCHQSPHGEVRKPNADCTLCHSTAAPARPAGSGQGEAGSGWARRRDSGFEHNRATRFPIDGTMHEAVPCTGRCHGKPPAFGKPLASFADCTPCHASVHGGSFGGLACATCHSDKRSFNEPRPFDHSRDTDWPLDGPHREVNCLACHQATQSRPPSRDCGGCHRSQSPHRGRFVQLDKAGRPTGKPMPCATCHALPSWQTAGFNHRAETRFALHQSHRVGSLYDCRQCHRGSGGADFQNLSALMTGPATDNNRNVSCVGCHRHRDAVDSPAHRRFPRDWFRAQGCVDRCHESDGDASLKRCRSPRGDADPACLGKLTSLGHGESNPFKLTGAHDLARIRDKCRTCHIDKQARFTVAETERARIRSDCQSCHQSKSPHGESFGENAGRCERCHDPATGTFKNVRRLDHGPGSRFPLLGRHQAVPCTGRCHPASLDLSRRFRPRPQTCADPACHGEKDIHRGRNGKACERCHSPSHPDGFKPPVEIRTIAP